jgi:hypothetical protein
MSRTAGNEIDDRDRSGRSAHARHLIGDVDDDHAAGLAREVAARSPGPTADVEDLRVPGNRDVSGDPAQDRVIAKQRPSALEVRRLARELALGHCAVCRLVHAATSA